MDLRAVLSQRAEETAGVRPASPTASVSSRSSSSSTVSSDNEGRRGCVAPFLLHLHQMLRREDPRVIRWAADGSAFEILDKEALTHQVLPRYFKNKNFASFQRQLNYFGFRKRSKACSQLPTYSREHFTRDDYGAMALVKRQRKKSRKRTVSSCSDDQPDAKRLALGQQTYWSPNDNCKLILPRPDASIKDAVATPPPHQVCAASPVWIPVAVLTTPPAASLPSLVAISPVRKAPTAFKLPPIHELLSRSTSFCLSC